MPRPAHPGPSTPDEPGDRPGVSGRPAGGPESRRAIYDRLVRDNAATLFAFARRMVGEHAAAEDVLQETYVEAWRSLDSLRDPRSGRAWLFAILRHRCARWVRKASRRPRATGAVADVAGSLTQPGPDVVHLLGDRERLQRLLDEMDPRFREALLTVFVEGLTPDEAAKALDIPRGTVLSRCHRARTFLRARLRVLDREET